MLPVYHALLLQVVNPTIHAQDARAENSQLGIDDSTLYLIRATSQTSPLPHAPPSERH